VGQLIWSKTTVMTAQLLPQQVHDLADQRMRGFGLVWGGHDERRPLDLARRSAPAP
jgi:hypothetical protein